MKKQFGILVTGLLTLVSLLPINLVHAQSEMKRMLVWHAYRGEEKSAFENVVKRYNKKIEDKKIYFKPLAVPYDAYADKISAAIPRGKGPDVFIFAQDRLGGWIEAGNTLESIDFYAEDEELERFPDSLISTMTYNDTLYGLPFNFKMPAMIYNKKLVKNAPKTTDELTALAEKITDKKIGRFGLAYEYSNFFFHSAILNAFGGKVFQEGGLVSTMVSKENIASVEFMLKWFEQHEILPAEPSSSLITSLFNDGKAAIVFSGPWMLGEISPDIDYAIAPMPIINQLGKAMAPWMSVEGLYISKSSKDKEQSYDFIKYLTSYETALVMGEKGQQLPSNIKVWEHEVMQKNTVAMAFKEQMKTAVPMPNYAQMTLMWSPATTAMNKIVKGTASPKAALLVAQNSISKDIMALSKSH
jgi:arabinogalactan oligomer/maltooligosaccharide transport system substrate-binding protein